MALKDLLETAGSIWLQGESIKADVTKSNNAADDFERKRNGVDSDGSTLVSSRIVAGVPNGALLVGVAAVIVVGIAAYMVSRD